MKAREEHRRMDQNPKGTNKKVGNLREKPNKRANPYQTKPYLHTAPIHFDGKSARNPYSSFCLELKAKIVPTDVK